MHQRSRTMRILILLSLILFSLCFLPGCKKKETVKRKPPAVIVSKVSSDNLRREWELVAQTVSDPKVDLRARVSGFIEKRSFQQGAFVKKGELLLQIEKGQYQAAVEQAEAEVSVKQAVLDNAKIAYDRNQKLLNTNAVSQAEFDQAKADKLSAEGNLKSAQAKLTEAKLDLSYTDIKAPFDGRIGLEKYSVGNLVGPDSGVLATIVSLDPMIVEFNVSEGNFLLAQEDAVNKKVPMSQLLSELEVKLILSDGTEYNKPGQIYFWNNQVNASTGTILLRAKFPNPDSMLLPGQYVKIKIISTNTIDSIFIPQSAVLSDLGGKYVLIVDEKNIVATKRVELGYSFDKNIIVTNGLKKGEKVISQGLQKVRPGIEVDPTLDTTSTVDADQEVPDPKAL